MNSGSTSLVARRSRAKLDVDTTSRIDPPAAGQYWRLRRDLDEVESNRANHPAMDAGTVLLINEVETQVDGTPHAVRLAAHPRWHESPRMTPWMPAFMYDDFLELWEPIDNGDQIRAGEIAALQSNMAETQRAMLAPPPRATPVGALAHQPAPNTGGDGRELATEDGLRDMAAYAASMKEEAEQKVAWISKHTEKLGEQTHQLAMFHQERAEAMLARANATMKSVEKILDTVRKLKLYTGEGIEVVQVCDGAPAPAGARLTFYQDVLSLDEELLIHIDDGGMDHGDIEELPTILKDKAVADRLIPAARGFVLCRFRTRDKEFFKVSAKASAADALGTAMANARENEIAKENRLLYRDGERFYLISASEVFPGIKQLLPSTAEQDSYFQRRGRWRGDDGGTITPDDLDFAAAQRDQLGALNDYAKVLVICWGLHDRTDLFSTTSIPRFSSWLDAGVQSAFMALVSHDVMLGQQREGYSSYSGRMNAYLGAGSMVVVHVGRCTQESAPGLYQGGSETRTYVPVERFAIERVHIEKGRPYIEFAARYDGFRHRVSRGEKRIKCYLDERAEMGFLVLDRLHSEDLTYYLTSREQRRSYLEYVEMFQVAREYVRHRDAVEEPIRAALRQAVADSKLEHDVDALEGAITSAIATWRAARGGDGLVLPGDPKWREASVPLLNALHAALTPHDDRIAAAQALAARNGRTPLRLTHAGNGAWHLYATSTDAERDSRIRPWTWIADLTLRWGSDGSSQVVSAKQRLLHRESDELVVHEWPEANDSAWRAKPPGSLSLKQIVGLLDAAEHGSTLGGPDVVGCDWLALAKEGLAWSRRHSKGMVVRPVLVVPIGTAELCKFTEHRSPGDKNDVVRSAGHHPAILCWSVDLWGLCYARASEADRAAVKLEAVRIYKNEEHAESMLKSDNAAKPRLGAMSLRTYKAHAGKAHFLAAGGGDSLTAEDGWHFGNPDGNEAKIVKSQRAKGNFGYWTQPKACRVTSLGSFGAAEFPFLAEVCERPAQRQPDHNAKG